MPILNKKNLRNQPNSFVLNGNFIISNFNKLWVGETVSYFGTQITNVAFPLTAIAVLHADPGELGILNALAFLPFLLFTLLIGIYVDRRTKKKILITANLIRALLLLGIPVTYWLGILTIHIMYVVIFFTGVLTVAFDAAFQTYIPILTSEENLVRANAKFISSSSAATAAGPGIGGYIIQFFGSAFAILINVFTFLFSALCIWKIDHKEVESDSYHSGFNFKKDILESICFVLKNPYIRPIIFEAATYNFFEQIIYTLILIYAKDNLHLSAGMIGLFFSFGGIGSVIGSLFIEKIVNRIGIGPSTIISMVIACSGQLTILLTIGTNYLTNIILLIIGFLINGFGLGLSNVTCTTLRQFIIPKTMLARALSSSRLLTWGPIPFGAFIGGYLGNLISLYQALALAILALPLASLWVIFSRLWKLKKLNKLATN